MSSKAVFTFVSFKLSLVLLFWEGRSEARKQGRKEGKEEAASLPFKLETTLAWGQLCF